MDRPVVHQVLDGTLDEAMLVDPRQSLELRRAHDGAQVVAAALVEHLDGRAGQRLGDQRFDLGDVRDRAPAPRG